MSEVIELGAITTEPIRKRVKHVHLSVHPPDGRVTRVAPEGTRPEVARAYPISKLGWIRQQQLALRWQPRLGVQVAGYFLQRMKTKWGSCSPASSTIRLNTELVKKPRDLLEYVVVHEMLHLLEPSHNERFMALISRHWPIWQESRRELNALPLAAEDWPE